MKKITITFLVLMIFLSTSAQHFGIQAGSLATNVQWRNDIYTVNTLVKPGFMAGVTLDLPIKNTMAVNIGLNYKWAGAALTDSTDIAALRLGYVSLDVTFNYIFETNGAIRPYVEGGSFGAYLVNARSLFKPEKEDLYYEDVKIGTANDDDIIPWDVGLTIGGGIYLGKWKLGLGYMGTIIDLSPDPEWILRNKVGYLKATYFFNKKKDN